MSVAAIVTAAGSGSRLGHALPKALAPLGGTPLVVHAVRAILEGARGAAPADRLERVVVTAPADRLPEFHQALRAAGLDGPLAETRLDVVAGGSTRQGSVAAGLAVLPPDVDVVLVHDAARALVPADVVRRVIGAVRAGHGAVVPALAVTDTIKRVGLDEDDAPGSGDTQGWPVVETVAREELRAVQTPQGFARELLDRAHAAGRGRAHDEAVAASDDAGLVEQLGEPVWVVAGHADAAKITTPWDLAVAGLVLAGRPPQQDGDSR
ncbi:2-C-methyl-D-erythritol 4-phosphate cytidylyltransferase [Cellulomonas cellasea]|uniref:2-C-methyl-D-erythritol 4-phosphate cytidylyltransferase n=1 Tax=Cellulomonas cellasea TaxID=43670 RepID=UPI0025A35677|nr:2-C-methyl-D-erythritol 4-phosphate cytidylyltransferase [Cellulomonas cellasea]MDM8083472.1 2-C-methyl-D-erythritol 4-phosphate cytidylyltransferase [Cellulomonas cellasea]